MRASRRAGRSWEACRRRKGKEPGPNPDALLGCIIAMVGVGWAAIAVAMMVSVLKGPPSPAAAPAPQEATSLPAGQ